MRAMVSAALPALTVLTARIERLGQSCARAAGARVTTTAHAVAPHHVRNDIDTSLECGRSSVDFVGRVFVGHVGLRGGPYPRRRPAVRRHARATATHALRSRVARGGTSRPKAGLGHFKWQFRRRWFSESVMPGCFFAVSVPPKGRLISLPCESCSRARMRQRVGLPAHTDREGQPHAGAKGGGAPCLINFRGSF